jgi:hypothetical protein
VAFVQTVLKSILPAAMAKRMEEESRAWKMRCPEGHEISVWDAGGIRYKASGKPVRLYRCKGCGKVRRMTLYKSSN